MLRSPRRLPQRYSRKVNPQMRRLVERTHKRQKQHVSHRFMRMVHRFQRKGESIRKVVIQFSALLLGGLVLLFIGLAMFSPLLQIKEIRIARSDQRIDTENVQFALAPLFGKHLFFLSTQEVGDLLKQSVPDLSSAVVTKSYPSSLQIRMTLDPIIAKLVIDDPDNKPTVSTGAIVTGSGTAAPIKTGEDYLTQKGIYVVYQPSQVQAASGTQLLQLTFVDWAVRPEPWKQLIKPAFLATMQQAESELQSQFGLAVKSRVVYVRAREFHLQTPKYSLWFDMRSSVAEQLLRYRLFTQSAGVNQAKVYVDLRLKDKIVYR